MKLSKIVAAAVLGGASVVSVAGRCDAGVTVVSSNRVAGIGVDASEINHPLDEFKSSQSSGPLKGEFTAFYQPPPENGPPLDIKFTHSSFIGASGVKVSGTIDVASGENVVQYKSLVGATFDVTTSTPFSLKSSLGFAHSLENSNFSDDPYLLKLTRIGTNPANIFTKFVDDTEELGYEGNNVSVNESGTLEPGRYQLLFNVGGEFIYDEQLGGKYSLDFALGGGGATPPSAVPLPPAACVGGITMGGLALSQWRRRKLADAND